MDGWMDECYNVSFIYPLLLLLTDFPFSGVATANHRFPFTLFSVSSILTPTTCISISSQKKNVKEEWDIEEGFHDRRVLGYLMSCPNL